MFYIITCVVITIINPYIKRKLSDYPYVDQILEKDIAFWDVIFFNASPSISYAVKGINLFSACILFPRHPDEELSI